MCMELCVLLTKAIFSRRKARFFIKNQILQYPKRSPHCHSGFQERREAQREDEDQGNKVQPQEKGQEKEERGGTGSSTTQERRGQEEEGEDEEEDFSHSQAGREEGHATIEAAEGEGFSDNQRR